MKLLILDRDGTLNRSREDYVAAADEWEALPGALEAVAKLNQGGWRVVLATNQSGIGRGLIDIVSLNAIHAKMHKQLAAVGARVDAVFFCPHAPEEGCHCRKPATGLFEQIGSRYGIPLATVPVAGNALRHVQAGTAAGCPSHLLLTGQSEHLRDIDGNVPEAKIKGLDERTMVHLDLPAFAEWLLNQPAAAAAT